MALLPILRYPDPRLHTVAKPVATVDERIRRLVDDMLETMYEAEGVGLAATQVDVHERVIVIDTSDPGPPLAHLNAPRQERLGLGLLQPDPRHHLLIDRLQTLLILGAVIISGQKRTALQGPIP